MISFWRPPTIYIPRECDALKKASNEFTSKHYISLFIRNQKQHFLANFQWFETIVILRPYMDAELHRTQDYMQN